MKSTGPFAALAALLLSTTLAAQSAAIILASTDLTIDPGNSDSFTVQGSFSGLSFDSAQTVTFSLGQFSGSIDLAGFVQQPNSNVFIYQDATGAAPAWLSSLTLDLDAQTFTASAAGTTLAGLPNPFAVEFGNESTSACVMARVQSTGGTTYQLTPGDGAQEPCQMGAPQASPPSVPAGAPTAVKFEVDIQPTANLDPASVQLFRADPNGQPAGPALCTLRDSGDGAYGCIVQFNEANPGPIPLLVQANAGGNLLLAPGFYQLVVAPPTQADIDNIAAAADAASSAWDANFAAYGDTGQARAQTLASLRGLPGIADVRLLEDGLSIGIPRGRQLASADRPP